MKLISTLMLFAAFLCTVSGQGNKFRVADQFLISANGSVNFNYRKFRPGFGAGVYRTFLSGKFIRSNLGIEYSRTREFHKSVLIGHFGHYENVTYSKNCISLPINFSIHPGQTSKIFFELGGFYDWVISSHQQGYAHTYVPDSNGQPQEMYFEVDESFGLVNSFGGSIGLGVRMPGHITDGIVKFNFKQNFPNRDFDKYQVLRSSMHLHAGIILK